MQNVILQMIVRVIRVW